MRGFTVYQINRPYAPINVNPQRGVGHMWGILHPHPGDFDQHFGPDLGQFELNDFY